MVMVMAYHWTSLFFGFGEEKNHPPTATLPVAPAAPASAAACQVEMPPKGVGMGYMVSMKYLRQLARILTSLGGFP